MAKIYTKQGDEGETQLLGGRRVPKCHPQVEAYGTVDELNAALALAATGVTSFLGEQLEWVQERLFAVGTILAQEGLANPGRLRLDAQAVQQLELWIDQLSDELPEQTSFLLLGPAGGSQTAAQLHVARTVCRRAERRICALEADLRDVVSFFNRLADYLYVAARWISWQEGVGDRPVRITGFAEEDA